tara:strand:+ start:301 stop:987 length:687 start_codon:yes stop_codon:yes gene_type:complete
MTDSQIYIQDFDEKKKIFKIQTDFTVLRIFRQISDVWDNRKSPLYEGLSHGFAFVDERSELTTDLIKAKSFVGVVSRMETTAVSMGFYEDITEKATHNKRHIISSGVLRIPMEHIRDKIQRDTGCEDNNTLLKLQCIINEDAEGEKKVNRVFYTSGSKIDSYEKKEDSNIKEFDLGRFRISSNCDVCLLFLNRFVIQPATVPLRKHYIKEFCPSGHSKIPKNILKKIK